MSLVETFTAERRAHLLLAHFFNRTDRIAAKVDGEGPGPVRPEDPLDVLVRAHILGWQGPAARLVRLWQGGSSVVVGRFRLGSYAPAPNGTTRWVCIDIDGPGHSTAVADPTACAIATMRLARDFGLTPYLERSGGGHGWHVWVFFDAPIPAARARRLATLMVPRDVLLQNGGGADSRKNQGIEIFPKAEKVATNGVGNMVWLPWWSNAPEGANLFYDLDDSGRLTLCEREEFATVTRADVDLVLDGHEESAPDRPVAAPHRIRSTRRAETRDPGINAWLVIVLQRLDLHLLYGPWLTGVARSPGWLQCRDPWSPSGDVHPSAGVADGTGEARRGTFHSFIDGRTLSAIAFILERGMADDFEGACRQLAEWTGLPLPTPVRKAEARDASPPSTGLPIIIAKARQLDELSAEARQALHSMNATSTPTLFVRDGKLVDLEHGKVLRIRNLDRDLVISYLARAARWKKAPRGDGDPIDCEPPITVATDILKFRVTGFPELDSIVRAPVFDANRRLVASPGYDAGAKVWYEPEAALSELAVPMAPSDDQIAAARQLLLQGVFGEFPFVDDSGRAHTLAALLLFFVRRIVTGPAPLFHVDAPTPGTGKGLLVEAVLTIVLGRDFTSQPLPTREEEIMKTLLSALLTGRPVIFFDNIDQGRNVNSAALAQALTSPRISGRQLSVSEMVEAENLAVWFSTGNNVRFSQELSRRIVPIRLDAKSENPAKGRVFQHENLLQWVMDHRRQCVEAAITLVNAWIAKGSPLGTAKLAKFESWSKVTAGILEVAGIQGFLAREKGGTADLGGEGEDWRHLVEVWKMDLNGEPARPCELLRLCTKYGLLVEAVGEGSDRSRVTRFGNALTAVLHRVYGGVRLECEPGKGKDHGYSMWRLVPVPGSGEDRLP